VAVVSGGGQRVAVGRTALGPLIVVVNDAAGRPVSGANVAWTVTGGGGSVSAASTSTDADGQARVAFTAGAGEETNTVTATLEGVGQPATFTITAVAPAAVAIVGGDGQTARVSQPLAQPLEVRVTAGDNGPVPALPVAWTVTAGGGSVSAASTATNAEGRAGVTLTLGDVAGPNAVEAAPVGLAPVSFSATGSTPVTVQVDMLGIAFVAPGGGDDITILLGDTVRWVNRDAVQHTATSTSVPVGGTPFDSGLLSQGQAFSFVPGVRGTWVYFCVVHPATMRDARIVVQ
jgi:adhesin/invasin